MFGARNGCGKLTSKRLTLVSIALLVVSLASIVNASKSDEEERAYYLKFWPRLGYFAKFSVHDPYQTSWQSYFELIAQVSDPSLQKIYDDDWRKARPTGDYCIDFLIGYQTKDYTLDQPFELIALDACLEWLLIDSQEKKVEMPRLSSQRIKDYNMLKSDQELSKIWEGTNFKYRTEKIPEQVRTLLLEYMTNLMKINKEHNRSGCNSLWLQEYNKFVEDILFIDCQDPDETKCLKFGFVGGEDDTYLKAVLESTAAAGTYCYSVMASQIHGFLEKEYEESSSGPTSITKRFKSSKATKQSESMRWPREMVSILQLVSGISADSPVNLGRCSLDLNKIKSNDETTVARFTKALGKFAKEHMDKNSEGDGRGRARYGRAMTKLCRPYTDPKDFLALTGGVNTDAQAQERKPFDFYNVIYSLVRLTNHESIFKITKERFEEDIISNKWEALYLATFSCQIISMSFGEITYKNNIEEFNVMLKKQIDSQIAGWPIELLVHKLPKMYPDGKDTSLLPKSAFFGRKINLFKHRETKEETADSDSDSDDDDEPTQTQAPAIEQPKPQLHPAHQMIQNKESSQSGSNSGSKFFTLFSRNKNTQQPTSPPATSAAAPTPPPPPPAAAASPQILPPSFQMMMQPQHLTPTASPAASRETIEMFKKLKGYVPDSYKGVYPELENSSGVYPKELGNNALFHNPSVVKSPDSLYNSREWQEVPWAKKEKKSKKVEKPERRKKSHRTEEDLDDDDDEDAEEKEVSEVAEKKKDKHRRSRKSEKKSKKDDEEVDEDEEEQEEAEDERQRRRHRRSRRARNEEAEKVTKPKHNDLGF